MNMHHITKSLFVGAAIVGTGVSSGRAEAPLSGETRARNATVKKLEPLFEKAGVGFNADKLRFLIHQSFFEKRLSLDDFIPSKNVCISMKDFIKKQVFHEWGIRHGNLPGKTTFLVLKTSWTLFRVQISYVPNKDPHM